MLLLKAVFFARLLGAGAGHEGSTVTAQHSTGVSLSYCCSDSLPNEWKARWTAWSRDEVGASKKARERRGKSSGAAVFASGRFPRFLVISRTSRETTERQERGSTRARQQRTPTCRSYGMHYRIQVPCCLRRARLHGIQARRWAAGSERRHLTEGGVRANGGSFVCRRKKRNTARPRVQQRLQAL